MLPDFPKTYLQAIGRILFLLAVITGMSLFAEFIDRSQTRNNTLALEMAKKGFCLRAIVGDGSLQYQPCVPVQADVK